MLRRSLHGSTTRHWWTLSISNSAIGSVVRLCLSVTIQRELAVILLLSYVVRGNPTAFLIAHVSDLDSNHGIKVNSFAFFLLTTTHGLLVIHLLLNVLGASVGVLEDGRTCGWSLTGWCFYLHGGRLVLNHLGLGLGLFSTWSSYLEGELLVLLLIRLLCASLVPSSTSWLLGRLHWERSTGICPRCSLSWLIWGLLVLKLLLMTTSRISLLSAVHLLQTCSTASNGLGGCNHGISLGLASDWSSSIAALILHLLNLILLGLLTWLRMLRDLLRGNWGLTHRCLHLLILSITSTTTMCLVADIVLAHVWLVSCATPTDLDSIA